MALAIPTWQDPELVTQPEAPKRTAEDIDLFTAYQAIPLQATTCHHRLIAGPREEPQWDALTGELLLEPALPGIPAAGRRVLQYPRGVGRAALGCWADWPEPEARRVRRARGNVQPTDLHWLYQFVRESPELATAMRTIRVWRWTAATLALVLVCAGVLLGGGL